MHSRLTPAVLACLVSLGMPSTAMAQPSEKARITEIRALFAKLEDASKAPASVDKQSSRSDASWSRLQAWEPKGAKDLKLRKIVVTSGGEPSKVERQLFFQGDALFFAFYVTTASGSAAAPEKQEERLYFEKNGQLIRWQHNEERKPIDGQAVRWGAQAQNDAKVAKALASGKASPKGFEPITCIVAQQECQPMAGDCDTQVRTNHSLLPPPGLPMKANICTSWPWYAGASQSCSFKQKGQVLEVTRSGEDECGEDPDCDGKFEEVEKLPLTPEMGRTVECELPERQEEASKAQ